jgi:hypothetical protein
MPKEDSKVVLPAVGWYQSTAAAEGNAWREGFLGGNLCDPTNMV